MLSSKLLLLFVSCYSGATDNQLQCVWWSDVPIPSGRSSISIWLRSFLLKIPLRASFCQSDYHQTRTECLRYS